MKSILQFPDANGAIMIQSTDTDKAAVVGTSKLDDVVKSISDSLAKKLEVLNTISDAVSNVLKNSQRTFNNVEIEFGLCFTGKGNVYVVQAEAEATIKVKLTFDPQILTNESVR
jgi:hypothetical protein